MKTTSFTPLRTGILLLTGFLLGLLLISKGWADSAPALQEHHAKHAKKTPHHPSKKKATHTVAKNPKKKKSVTHTASAHKAATHKAPAPKMALKTYAHPAGQYQLKYPKGWQVDSRDNAMIVKSQNMNGSRGVLGIVRRPDDAPNEEAVAKEFSADDRPQDLVQRNAQLGGLPATKITGSSKDDPSMSLVEYYVKNPEGHQYYVLLRAPKSDWKRYNVAFSTMLNSLSFN